MDAGDGVLMPQALRWEPFPRQSSFLKRQEYEVLYGGSKMGAKALSLDTVLATPSGFTTMGEVQVGDYLFDEQGLPCRVTYKSPVFQGQVLYRVKLGDGSVFTADAGHRWLVFSEREIGQMRRRTDAFRERRRRQRPLRGSGKRPDLAERNRLHPAVPLEEPRGTVLTTQEMLEGGIRGRSGWNYRIPVAKALQLPEVALPLDPYLLGVWLGDGSAQAGKITTSDLEIVTAFEEVGFSTRRYDRYDYGVHGLTTILRASNVLRNKHIPSVYFRAAESQRVALLMGLMDTDGTCEKDGRCSFTNTNRELVDGVRELCHSLGIKTTVTEKHPVNTVTGIAGKPAWQVTFTTARVVFRLPRKATRQRRFERLDDEFRAIVAIEPVVSEPVQCIAVDSPSHLYLAGKAMVPTHNTDALLMWSILRRQKYAGSRGLFIRRQISEILKQGAAWERAHELLGDRVKYRSTPVHVILFPNGSTLEFGHCKDEESKQHYQGAQYDDICYDQLEQFTESMYLFISAACRTPQGNPPRSEQGEIIEPRIRASANPGSVGHAWVKARFVDVGPPEKPVDYTLSIPSPSGSLSVRRSKIFIPSTLFDNPYASPEYAATLYALPPHLRDAYLYGKWDVFVGQAFPDFHPITETGEPWHVIPEAPVPQHWRRFGFHDWGYASLCYVGWGAIDPSGGVVIYRELAVRGWSPDEIAAGVLDLQGGERVSVYWSGHDIFAEHRARLTRQQLEILEEKGALQLSIVDQYRAAGWSTAVLASSIQRLPGKQRIHTLLKPRPVVAPGQQPQPWLRIMQNCPVLIKTLQLIQADPKRNEDVITDYLPDDEVRDDAYDALRYGLMSIDVSAYSEEPAKEAIASWRR